MLTRREVLIGGGALVALSAAGAMEIGARRRTSLLHRLGLTSSPDHSVPPSQTQVQSGTLTSTHMVHPVSWSFSVPAGDLAGVVYCLHGHDDDHRFAFDQIHLPDVAAAAGSKLAIAAVDGGADSYWHARDDGNDPLSMLLTEFIPMVEARIRAPARALLGWSMGGYGALLAAETEPEHFAAVAAASPALWTSPGATAPGAFDGAGDYHRHDVYAGIARLGTLEVRIDCGTGDPFYAAAKRFAADLRPAPEGSFGPGFHDAAYWRSVAPAQVDTITKALTQR